MRALILLLTLVVPAALAEEGMWLPRQLPDLGSQLAAGGLEIDASELSDLTGYPLNAVIDLGGCTASFVSPQGLAVTNHHCAYGSIQHNSREESNLIEDGFLARSRADELPAAPGSRLLVTVALKGVTAEIRRATEGAEGLSRFRAIERRIKELIAECELDAGHRCDVAAFHGGLEYRLIKQLEIRDVRLVYAPRRSIGVYGGEVDNWMWPRHTGDFAFYRAYVDREGRPAEHSPANVPYRPAHHLKVSTRGVAPGDFVMAAGYPGITYRYRLTEEVRERLEWYYPTRGRLFRDWIEIIERETAERPEAGILYSATVRSLANAVKNYDGMLRGLAANNVVGRKAALEAELAAWIEGDEARRRSFLPALRRLQELIAQQRASRERDLYYRLLARRPALLGAATSLYRLSQERRRPDAEREPGFQERDLERIEERLRRIDSTFAPPVDRAIWRHFILAYAELPDDARVAAFDDWFGITGGPVDEEALDRRLDEMYTGTKLGDTASRLAWLAASPAELAASDDPFIRLAVALYPSDLALENEAKEIDGLFDAARPQFMSAMIAFLGSRGSLVYPDANGTLRVTWGRVEGYSPRDAVRYSPFTTLVGIVEKDTGEDPFDAPPALLAAVHERRFGGYDDAELGSVPVNFLSTLDTTGGNSGSPTLDARGELVGLLFDGNWESIVSDWDFNPLLTRSIHVDIRYALWVMAELDEAGHLLEEMAVPPAGGQGAVADVTANQEAVAID